MFSLPKEINEVVPGDPTMLRSCLSLGGSYQHCNLDFVREKGYVLTLEPICEEDLTGISRSKLEKVVPLPSV